MLGKRVALEDETSDDMSEKLITRGISHRASGTQLFLKLINYKVFKS